LTPDQIQSLNDWESTFKDKYDIVGNLIDPWAKSSEQSK
jgi:hypothetical protein